MSYFFNTNFLAALKADQTIMNTATVKMVLFPYAPAFITEEETLDARYTGINSIDTLATTLGWGPYVTHTAITQTVSVNTTARPPSKYVIIANPFDLPDDFPTTNIKAIAFVYMGPNVPMTNNIMFVTDTPLSGGVLLTKTDAVIPLTDAGVGKWLFSWSLADAAAPLAITEGPLALLKGARSFDQARTQHVWIYPQRINMIANPSFELNAAYWRSNGALTQQRLTFPIVKAASVNNLVLSAAQTVDTVALVAGDRVLVKNQATPAQNGVYLVAAGAWTRATDADTEAELFGSMFYVQNGTQRDTLWYCTTPKPITVGTTNLVFDQRYWSGGNFAGRSEVSVGYLTPTIGTVTIPDPGLLPNEFMFLAKVRGPANNFATVVSQYEAAGTRAWAFQRHFNTPGRLRWVTTTDGTTANVALDIPGPTHTGNDEWLALAVTRNNGSGAGSVRGLSSTDGVIWTPHAPSATIVQNLFDSSTVMRVGARSVNIEAFDGRIYSVELRTGLDPAAGAGVAPIPGYISLPGTASNNLTFPTTPEVNITGDICVVVKVLNWANPAAAAIQTLVGRYGTGAPYANQRSWYFGKETATGKRLRWSWSANGTGVSDNIASSAAVPDGYPFVAVSFQPAVPRCRFWYSLDGITWLERTNIASPVNPSPTMFNGTAPIAIGSISDGGIPFPGDIGLVSIRNGVGADCTVGGTEVFRFDASSDLSPGTNPAATSVTASTGQTLTVNRSASDPKTVIMPSTAGTVWKFDANDYPGTGTVYTDPRGREWTLTAAAAITPAKPIGWRGSGAVVIESNMFPMNLPRRKEEGWTIQAKVRSDGEVKVGLIAWEADFAETGSFWGPTMTDPASGATVPAESWHPSGGYLNIRTMRRVGDVVTGLLRLETNGTYLEIDQMMVEPGLMPMNKDDWPYFDGSSSYVMNGGYSWYGNPHASYSMWYAHRDAVMGRLFAWGLDPEDQAPGGVFTDEETIKQGLVYQWVPAGTPVQEHYDILYPNDPKTALPPVTGSVLPYKINADDRMGVLNPWL